MKIYNALFLLLFLSFAKVSHAQLEDVVPEEYRNWLTGYRHNTYMFMDSSNRANYKERIQLDSCYTFFALIPLEGQSVQWGEMRFIDIPGHPVPDTLKKRAKEMIRWTDGKWAGPSKKVIFQFVYNKPNFTISEGADNGVLSFKYGWATKDSKNNELYIMDTNYLSVVNIW